MLLVLSACAGGGGGGNAPGAGPSPALPSSNPPPQLSTGGETFFGGSELGVALPLYGISLPFAAVVAPGSVFAGRRLDSDGSYAVSWKAAAGGIERGDRFAWNGQVYESSRGDAQMIDFGLLGTTQTRLNYMTFGLFTFASPSEQTLAFYAGFETPATPPASGGISSYQGVTIAGEERGTTEFALVGNVHLEIDFNLNRIFGSINNLKLIDENGNLTGDYDYRFILSNVTVVNAGGSRGFSGSLIAQKLDDGSTSTNATTLIDVRFFGVTGYEAGGVWQSDAIAGRETWGSFGTTPAQLNNTWTFLQAVGNSLPLQYRTQFLVRQSDNQAFGTIQVSPSPVWVVPLSGGSVSFIGGPIGTMYAPGAGPPPNLVSTPYLPAVEATALAGEYSASPATSVFLAERGTLAYARFGYWMDATRVAIDNNVEFNHFSTGVQTPISAVPASGSGHYAGTTVGLFSDNVNPPVDFTGKVNFVASFGTSSIAGTAHSFQQVGASAGSVPFASITFESTPIVNAAFTGGIATARDGTGTVVSHGPWAGHFYGPTAEELAGVYAMSPGFGGSVPLSGSFGASR